ncbi:MAG: transposase [Burkholderiales bacterium]|jgi:putative transposase|nr:transposase [Burkholderiales bacterium]
MVSYRRNRIAGGTYFFTVNLRDRRQTLLVDHVGALREVVRGVRDETPFMIDAMVILPDHWHAVWTLPEGDTAYARRIRLIKSRFTRRLLAAGVHLTKDGRGDYDLWQKRYWEHTIRDDLDFEAHVNYVHINPVKHGYVRRAVEWPHSTFHRYIRNGILPADWAFEGVDGEFGERNG